METTTHQELDELAQRIAATISEKRGIPTQVHHIHYATGSTFCLGRFGANLLIKAGSPAELLVRGEGFLEGMRHPESSPRSDHALN
jgi:hypothetical protein